MSATTNARLSIFIFSLISSIFVLNIYVKDVVWVQQMCLIRSYNVKWKYDNKLFETDFGVNYPVVLDNNNKRN